MPHQNRPNQPDPEHPVLLEAQVFEDNFNVLSQIIHNYPTANFTGSLENSESVTESSLDIISQEPEKKSLSNAFKYYLLILFSCTYLIYGCQSSLFGPAMTDITKILNTTAENISLAFSIKCIIYCISTILVNYSFKIFGKRQLQYGFAVACVGIVNGLIPFMTSFTQYLCSVVFVGFASAFVDLVTNLVVLEIWSLNSKIYLQIAHGAFTVGTIFGPLLIGPFLSKNDNSSIPLNQTLNETTNWTLKPNFSAFNLIESLIDRSLTDQPVDPINTRIRTPYLLMGCLMVLAAIIVLISQFLNPYIPEKRKLFAKQKSKMVDPTEEQIENSQASMSSPEFSRSDSDNSNSNCYKKPKPQIICQQINLPKAYYGTFLGLIGLLLSIYSCMDGLTGMFMPSFLTKSELKIKEDDAAFMSSVIYMSMATGRIFSIIFALKTTCKVLLFFNLSMTLIGYIMLTFFAMHSKLITWISMFVIGGGLSSTYPLILSYIENRIVITNTVQLYLMFAGVLLSTFVPIIVGHFIDTVPRMFTYINVTLCFIALLLMLVMHTIDIWKKSLVKKIKDDQAILVDEQQ